MLIEQPLILVIGCLLELRIAVCFGPMWWAVIQKRGRLAEGLLSLRSEVGGKGERLDLFLSLGFDARVAIKLSMAV
jgi:hypothetical protein